jgi:hypothetical protein
MLRSCYRIKAQRSCCTDPRVCATSAIYDGKTLIMGAFIEDFELAGGDCDLDAYNSRVAKTPEYPEGTRVYVMTFDANGVAAFPFIFGTRYWGAVTASAGGR